MSDKKNIAFPNKINRARLIGPLESDTVIVTFCSLLIFYFSVGFLLTSAGAFYQYGSVIFLTIGTTFLYIYYKKNAKRGFLWHWLYVKNLYLPKYKGYEGLPKDFLPKGYEYEFRD